MLSIITNFGCDERCPYCIWQQHFLSSSFTSVETTDWPKLFQIIAKFSPSRISISGGGDPLFALEANIKWWQKLFANLPHVLFDLHTAKIAPPNFARRFNKYVFHAKDLAAFYDKANELLKLCVPQKRVVMVADSSYTKQDYIQAAQYAKAQGFAFAVRQKVENNKPLDIYTDFFRSCPDLFYIEHRDYNLYYMPDNQVYTNFLEAQSRVEI